MFYELIVLLSNAEDIGAHLPSTCVKFWRGGGRREIEDLNVFQYNLDNCLIWLMDCWTAEEKKESLVGAGKENWNDQAQIRKLRK